MYVIINQSIGVCDQGDLPKHVICQISINKENVGLWGRSGKGKAHYCIVQCICTFGLRESYSPLSNVGGQRWISAVTAHRERDPPPTHLPVGLPYYQTACLASFPRCSHLFSRGKLRNLAKASPRIGSEVAPSEIVFKD